MALVCLSCGARVADDQIEEPCAGDENFYCGARKWVWVDEPKKPLTFTKTDRLFLKVNRIGTE